MLIVVGLIGAFMMPGLFMGYDPGFLLLIGILCMAYCVIGVLCSTALERGRSPVIMRSGIWSGGIVLAVCVILLVLAFQGAGFNRQIDQWMRVLVWPFLWPCFVGILAMLLVPRCPLRVWPALRTTAVVLTALLAISIAGTVTFYPDASNVPYPVPSDYWEARREFGKATEIIISLLSIAAGAAIAITLLIACLPATMFASAAAANGERKRYMLTCPRCGNRHEAATGEHHCAQCGLRVVVNLP